MNRYYIFLLVLMVSCSKSELSKKSISLRNEDGNIIVRLPKKFEGIKNSVHLSDCRPCGKHHIVLGEQEFLEVVEDTTGWIIPWKENNERRSFFLIEEDLYPIEFEKQIHNIDYNLVLNQLSEFLKLERGKLIEIKKADFTKDKALVEYQLFNTEGRIVSQGIECWTNSNNQSIRIYFQEFVPFEEGEIRTMWTSIKNLRIE